MTRADGMTGTPPIVWLDPVTGTQQCSCGWLRPATVRHGKQTASEVILDLSQAEFHANNCVLHVAYLSRQLQDLPRILGEHVPDTVIQLLQTLISAPVIQSRRIVGRWLTDLEDEDL